MESIGLLVLGLALARAPLSWCVLAVAGAIGSLALLLNPALGLYALAFVIPFGSLVRMPLGLALGPGEVVLAATAMAFMLRAAVTHRDDLRWHPLLIAWLPYVLILAFSLLIASDLREASFELAKWIELTLVALMVSNLHDPGQARNLTLALLCAASAEAALGIYQFLFQVGPEGFVVLGRYMRAYGTFDQPNPFAGYLGLVLPLACGIVYGTARQVKAALAAKEWPTLLMFGVAVVACMALTAGIIASWSRGALLGVAFGLVLIIGSLGPRVWLAAATAALLVVAVVPVEDILTAGEGFARLVEPITLLQSEDLVAVEITDANFSTVERAAHWLAAWRMFEKQPWTGVGLGQYATVYPSVAVPRWQDPLGHAHNIYLNMLAETGLPGLLAFVGLFLAWAIAAWRAVKRSTGWQRAVAIGTLGMLGHLAAHSLVDNLFVHDMYLYMGLLFGLLIRPSSAPKETSDA